jgi:hypothetical protein
VQRANEVEIVMHDHLIGPVLGVVIIVALAGTVTLVCFVAMFRMLFRPGETDPHHPKYEVLRDDR